MKATKVTYILKDTEEYTGYYEISKNDNIVTVTNNLNESTYYYLDERGRNYLIVDEGKTESIIYEEKEIGADQIVISRTNPQKENNNILLNGCFERMLNNREFAWDISNDDARYRNDKKGYNGRTSLRVETTTENTLELKQNVTYFRKYKDEKIYFKGYISGKGKVNLSVKIGKNTTSQEFIANPAWQEVELGGIALTSTQTEIEVVISVAKNSKVRLSCFSLVAFAREQSYNYIENGKFDKALKYWETTNFGTDDIVGFLTDNYVLDKMFENVLLIKGTLTNIKELKQEIALIGGAGEELLFSFFKKAYITSNDICYAYIKVKYTLFGEKTYNFKISPNIKGFEKVIQSIITESTYNKVTVGILYLGASDVILSDFGLFKEGLGNYYLFNESKSLLEIANGSSELEIEYNKNEKVKRIANETGEIFEYTYDDLGNIILITDSSGNSFNFEYDENGYLKKSKITTIDGKTLEKELVNDSRGNVLQQTDYDGNITHKVKIKNETIEENINYQYDASGRLIKEKCYDGTNFKYNYGYKYNQSGDILEKIEYNISNEIISKEVYNYSTTNSSQLLSINKVNTNNEIIETKTITYLEEDPFRPATYKNNNLTWNGKRLTSYGTNTYKYNSEGIRISKTTSEGEYKYLLDGNKIIKEIKPNNKEIYYHYNENEELVGFNYNTKEYFYIRDITGNITNIIDSNGTIKVSYEYDAWGKVINIDGDEDLIEINSYLYKGYYYDKETSLYYCNSRYYDPEIRRWISIDDINYLDSETVNGVNLYAYCGNNPAMNIDLDGHAWYHWLIGAAIIVACAALTVVTAGGFAAAGAAFASAVTTTMAPTALSAVFAGATIGAATIGTAGLVIGGMSGEEGWSWENASQGFMIGSIAGAVIGGAWGGTHYALQNTGKMAVRVNTSSLKFRPDNPLSDKDISYWTKTLSQNNFKGYNSLPNRSGEIAHIDVFKGTNFISNGHHRVHVLLKYGVKYINVFYV